MSRWPLSTEASRIQPYLPAFFGPDCRPVVEQTVFFLLLGQPGEFGVEGMIDRAKRLLAVEDRWIGTGGVIEAVDLAGAEREFGVRPECGSVTK